ncbi:helix-turn-helix domain-containing protein [Paenibacillus sp. WQ 127069]|uniref:Helix-turn-helix domain-containing protein n=1 Tax=Paenibacillus baimaensis TaxID=2982185 RepID=A0ABT2UHK1_9BACL|nr:helix-turn-helix domain-containing protein [Paenibacillus sp. WQ 127069]MCU6794123.1 helix-turn-helix domain-containing protein [Paenibacillus sp. WQ 127069]
MNNGIMRFKQFQSKQNRLFLKILSYFLSLLIPIIIIGVSEYAYSISIMKNQFNERITTNLESAANTIDLYINTTQETGINFLFDYTVMNLLIPKDQQSLTIKSELWRLPRILQRSENIISNFTDSTFVYIDNQEVYVGAGVNTFNSYFNNIYKYEKYDTAFWINKRSSTKSIELLPVSSVIQEQMAIKQVVPIVMTNRIQNQNAVMVVNISVNAIVNALKGNAVFDSTNFVVLDGNQQIIYDEQGLMDGSPERSAWLPAYHEQGGAQDIEIQGKRYMIAHIKSNLYGWEYYSFTPLSEFNHHTVNILQMTVLLSIVLIVMGIIFSFVFSIRIYNPIRNIRDVIALKSDLGSGDHADNIHSNEFDLIRQGIDRLSDSNQQYKVKYDKHTSEYVEYSLLFLLKGHTLNQEEILRETLKADFGFTRAGFICCSVHFDFKEAFYEDIQDTERIYVINGIKKIIWSLLGRDLPAYVLEHRMHLFVGLVNVDEAQETELLYEAFNRMLGIFEYDIRMYYDITIGIGTFYTNVNDIGTSYNEAMTALGKRNKEKRFQIVDSSHMSIRNSYQYSLYDEQKLLNYLKLGDESAVSTVLEEIVENNMRRSMSYEHMGQLFKEMYVTGVRFLAEKGRNVTFLEMDQQLQQFTSPAIGDTLTGTKEELQQIIQAFYARIIEVTKAQKGQRSGNLVSLIEKYIQEHYTQDLGLEQIADEMGVSVKYVSRVFKDKTGVYLTDYINQVRIEKAKELLTRTEMKVNDIAESIGIHSRTTFLRVFKKVEGISPNEYRTLYKKTD